jgi:hypothetical protein
MGFLRKNFLCILIFTGFATGGVPSTIEGYFATLYRQCGTILKRETPNCQKLGKEVATGYRESAIGSGIAPEEVNPIVQIVEEVCREGCENRGKKGGRIIQSAVVKYQTLQKQTHRR